MARERSARPKEPTAVQSRVPRHQTPDRAAPYALAGSGTVCRAQLVPFQCSAMVWVAIGGGPALRPSSPTAVHDLADAHDTPDSAVPAGAASAWMVQVVPAERSTIALVVVVPLPDRVVSSPTAIQRSDALHDTLCSAMFVPAGRGIVWAIHRLPVHRSASTLVSLELSPTAMQSRSVGQDTPSSSPPPDGTGTAWTAQLVPSQCSASGRFSPPVIT